MENLINKLPESFLNHVKNDLGEEKYKIFVENFGKDSVRGIRINKQRILPETFLKSTKYNLKKLPFCDDGFIFYGDEKAGNDFEHLTGQIYFQEPSSMLAVCASEIEKEIKPLKVLDLCASPGGKTSQIVSRISPESVLYSNEIIKSRADILFSNVESQGFDNIVVLNEKPENLLEFEGFFDYVFVDAPCSGEGMFRKNPETIDEWSEQNVEMCAKRQKEILAVATKLVKNGGKLIYSTCTYNQAEDEQIVEWLCERKFELLDVSQAIKGITYPSSAKVKNGDFARKHYIDEIGEGQFVAVLKNNNENESNLHQNKHNKSILDLSRQELKLIEDAKKSSLFDFDINLLKKVGGYVYLLPQNLTKEEVSALDSLKFVSLGTKLGVIEKDRFEFVHSAFMMKPNLFKTKIELDDNSAKKYLHGEELMCDITHGENTKINKVYACVTKNGFVLGGVKITNGRLKNLYPKGMRI